MTILDQRGDPDTSRYSEFMHYALPEVRNREGITLVSGRYMLPSPTTGKLTAYSRATKVASTTSDDTQLNDWKIRENVHAILRAKDIRDAVFTSTAAPSEGFTDSELAMGAAFDQFETAVAKGADNKDIDNLIRLIHNLSGGADARELGSAVHDWLAELDLGARLVHQLPDYMQPYATAYQETLREAGLIPIPLYVERVVLNERGRESVAGRIDRIYKCADTGILYLGDIKTSKASSLDLNSVLLEYSVQFAVYGWATRMLSIDGRQQWEDMPEVDQETCVVVHVPRDQPERAAVIPFGLWSGGEALVTAMEVRAQRREVPKKVRNHDMRSPGDKAIRYVSARQALQNMTDPEEAGDIIKAFEDVWDDDLNEFGAICYELLTATTEETTNRG